MYNIKVLQDCNEEEYVAIVAAIHRLLDTEYKNDKLIVRRFNRTKENVPEWAMLGRQERFRNKF